MPEKTEPALADKEIIMAALNIKSMNFGTNFLTVGGDDDQVRGFNGYLELFEVISLKHFLNLQKITLNFSVAK